MKAIVYENYGSPEVLELKEVEKPVNGDNEVLIKVHAAALTPMDWHFMTGKPLIARIMAGGLFKPKNKILGTQVAGKVEDIGEDIKRFHAGDEVFGMSENCGGFAEYVCTSEDETWLTPSGLSFDEAACIHFSAMTALVCLCDLGQLKSGQKVLINGASGGVGTMAVPIAKWVGAQVTGVCSTKNLELVRSIGADHVIDYTQEDFTQDENRYDLIFDAVGKRSFSDCRRVLSPEGTYVTTEFSPALVIKGRWVSMTGSQKMIPMPPREPEPETKHLFQELLKAVTLKPVIDRSFPLNEVPEAFRYYEKGHTLGRVVIMV